MKDRIYFMAWAPSREIFIETMGEIKNPLNGEPLATYDEETDTLSPCDGVAIDLLGEITKGGEIDEEGNVIEEPTVIPGYHVNMFAYGDLIEALTIGLPTEGDVFETTHILELLDASMTFVPITEDGVPAGYEGTSGMRIFDPGVVSTPARVWL